MSLSYSDINTYLRCPKQFYYKDRMKIQRIRRDQTLHQGTMIHRLVMGGYLAEQRGQWWNIGVDEEYMEIDSEITDRWAMMPGEAQPELEMLDECVDIVQRYFEQNPFDGWEILHVEEEFSVTINGDTVTFTPDLVVRDPSGQVWIVDHKSTDTIEEGVPFASQQSLLYLAAVRVHYPEAVGFLFNYIRKKLPTQPRLNKTRNKETGLYFVNDLNRIDTEYQILFDFIRHEAPELMDDPRHRQRLAELRDQPDKFFATRRVLANEAALAQVIEETSWVIEDMARSLTTERWPRILRDDRGYTSCRKCEFESICAAELLDLNTDIVLRDYEPRDPKNPYDSKEDV